MAPSMRKLLVRSSSGKLRPTIDSTLKAWIWSLWRLGARGWESAWVLLRGGADTVFSRSRSLRRYHRLGWVHGVIVPWRAIAYIPILHPLLQLCVLQLIEVEIRVGRIVHKRHGRIPVGVEGPIIVVWKRLAVVKPILHTHVGSHRKRPICLEESASACRLI